MKKFFEYLENYLDTFNNNYILSENDTSLREFVVNNDFKNTDDKTLNLNEIKGEITKIIKTNDKNEEYILKKDFIGLKEKYDFDNKSNKIPDDLKEKVKLYKRNSEMESFEDFRKNTYSKLFKGIEKYIKNYKENGLNEKEIKEKLSETSNLFFQREFEIKFFHKESKDKKLPIDDYFKERDKEFNITVEYGKIKELQDDNSYELNIISFVNELSLKEVEKFSNFVKSKTLEEIEKITPQIIKSENQNSKLYKSIIEEIYSEWRKEAENEITKNGILDLSCDSYRTSLFLDSYFEKYDLKLMSFEKKELENNYNKKHNIKDFNKYTKELKSSNIIEIDNEEQIILEK